MLTPREVEKALVRLSALKRIREDALHEMDGIVAVLRSGDTDAKCLATWVEIGDALGVSKQTVQTRYRNLSWTHIDDQD